MNPSKKIEENISLHTAVAAEYFNRHPEIYNEIEQQRLNKILTQAILFINTNGALALDFGCGDGNLTSKLLQQGCDVIAADVTPRFVEMAQSLKPERVRPMVLNGVDLSGLENDSVDLVATYSVLHHVPDYLAIISEFCRVVKPGGIVFIDHERSEDYWTENKERHDFFEKYREDRGMLWYVKRLLSPKWWSKKMKKTLNPRYQEEGDIHVWPDDHIEWSEIRSVLHSSKFEILHDEDYLHYQPHYNLEDYQSVAKKFSDMRCLIARKLPTSTTP